MRTLLLTLTTCLLALPVQAKYSGGSGTAQNPYQIATAADLIALGETPADYDKHFILTADIDLDPNLPGRIIFYKAAIGVFTGIFDGNGHMISRFTIKTVYSWGEIVGLFGTLASGAEVKDLGLIGVNITISDTTGSSIILASTYEMRTGGLVGWNEGSVVRCYSSGVINVSGVSLTGGLVGRNLGCVASSYSTCTVRGVYGWIGALVGYNDEEVIQCYATGSVGSTRAGVGGLVGHNSGTVWHSVWDMEASQLPASPGGVGLTTAEMMAPYMLGLNGFANDPNWVLDAGRDYPRLAWQGTGGQTIPKPDIDWLSGDGTSEVPYRIGTAEQLILLGRASLLCDRHFVLDADIDLDPNLPGRDIFQQALIPVFSGVFDGNHHTISHLTIIGHENLGFFDLLAPGAEVKNLGVIHLKVNGSGLRTAGLVARNAGDVVCCYTSGWLEGGVPAGGLVGQNESGSVVRCYSTCSVSSGSHVGGLVGYNWAPGTVKDCYCTGAVSGDYGVGGLVGSTYGSVAHCYSTGTVSGKDSNVGGLVGGGAVIACFWDTQKSGQTFSAAGMGKTTAQMQTRATFLIWGTCGNEGVWTIDEGKDYPRLSWEERPGEPIRMPELPDLLLGSGTENDPFLICTPEELNTVGLFPCEWDKHFKLMADIDLSSFDGKDGRPTFNCIGENAGTAFTGVFDGNSHVISHLTIRGTDCVGLFAVLATGSEVKNLELSEVNVIGSGYNVGGLAARNAGAVARCFTSGQVNGNNNIGGLVGSNDGGSIAMSSSTSAVKGNNNVGGLTGYNDKGSITMSFSTGPVSGGRNVGGVAGQNVGTIENSYATGSVTGDSAVGGLVGENGLYSDRFPRSRPPGIISYCYSTSLVIGKESVGGLLGVNTSGRVVGCLWDTQTSGQATSAGGTSKTTAEMQTAKTFLDAGWDFVGETANGTEDIWWILEGKDYPHLWWEAK